MKPETGNWKLETGNWKLETGNWKLETRDLRFETRNSKVESRKSKLQNQVSSFKFQVSGFTLLEVMVAVSIISFVLVAVYKMHAQTVAMTIASRFYTTAPLLAQSKIAELEIKSADDLTSDSGDFGDDFAGYSWSASVEDVESEFLGSVAERLKRIDINVNFNEGEFVYTFRTYRLADEKG
ncbi:type IV pilus modification PilV family protein [Desulfonema magnum]|uniref:Prepilin-type cleavage/methylation N-terminal domain-containing protein n=1 Tax=Desulfonema magnum TaxID=45655 RepID=A0A975GUV9_9BACT|nr:prepilin-type N-terminal cleavage/methylation domain-containing protein [Desulfonema magnum]QTA93223.1 Prepilin-type cleavage/methylation N-terminal domain-containing protein [Desulfonema magnum]